MADEKKEFKLQIDIDDLTAQGVYSNFAVVNHSDTDFVLDFIYLQPMQPKAKVRSRIITTPKNAKKLLKALEANIKKYEKTFGTIPHEQAEEDDHELMH